MRHDFAYDSGTWTARCRNCELVIDDMGDASHPGLIDVLRDGSDCLAPFRRHRLVTFWYRSPGERDTVCISCGKTWTEAERQQHPVNQPGPCIGVGGAS